MATQPLRLGGYQNFTTKIEWFGHPKRCSSVQLFCMAKKVKKEVCVFNVGDTRLLSIIKDKTRNQRVSDEFEKV